MQLTIADINTTRTYHFEANEKDNSPNTEHLGFDTLKMAAIPKMHLNSREFDVTCQRPIGQGSSNLAHEIHFPAELSSNLNQIQLSMWIIRKSQLGEYDQSRR